MCTADGRVFGSVAEALRMANATMDYLNGPDGGRPGCRRVRDGAAVAGRGRRRSSPPRTPSVLARFDAADAHDSDGYGTSAAWLMAMTDMTRGDARAEVRRMRLLRDHPAMADALAAGDISKSQALAIADWTKKLPAELRAETITILVQAAQAGASLDDLRIIAGVALEQKWRASRPDADDDGFDDRYVQAGTTFGGAGVIRGNLTPECAAAVQAVLEALGKKAGPEDTRTEGQRFHDALQQGCELLIGAKMVPDRAGADTHVAVHIPFPELRQRPGAPEAEEVWLRGTAGEPGYLTGKDAEAAACDAVAEPVVTGHADMRVVDKIIALALAAAGITLDGADPASGDGDADDGRRRGPDGDQRASGHRSWGVRTAADRPGRVPRPAAGPGSGSPPTRCRRCGTPSPGSPSTSSPARPASPAGCAPPCSHPPTTPRRCRWTSATPTPSRPASAAPSCSATAAAPGPAAGDPPPGATCTTCSTRKTAAKPPSADCVLLCQFHHDICIHRRGWRLVLHPDGTTTAYGPDGQVLHSHSPPTLRAG